LREPVGKAAAQHREVPEAVAAERAPVAAAD